MSGELVGSIAETFMGTAFYMAVRLLWPPCLVPPCSRICAQPERIKGAKYKITSDVWSLGLTLVEIAMCEFPFPPHLTPLELLMHIESTNCGDLLRDVPEMGVKWTSAMHRFVGLWSVPISVPPSLAISLTFLRIVV